MKPPPDLPNPIEALMKQQKKQWQKPVLIIIGRGTPEENVLSACKTTANNTSPNSNFCIDVAAKCKELGLS
jgi:hypothetical protein